jgi:hypothetical protein
VSHGAGVVAVTLALLRRPRMGVLRLDGFSAHRTPVTRGCLSGLDELTSGAHWPQKLDRRALDPVEGPSCAAPPQFGLAIGHGAVNLSRWGRYFQP